MYPRVCLFFGIFFALNSALFADRTSCFLPFIHSRTHPATDRPNDSLSPNDGENLLTPFLHGKKVYYQQLIERLVESKMPKEELLDYIQLSAESFENQHDRFARVGQLFHLGLREEIIQFEDLKKIPLRNLLWAEVSENDFPTNEKGFQLASADRRKRLKQIDGILLQKDLEHLKSLQRWSQKYEELSWAFFRSELTHAKLLRMRSKVSRTLHKDQSSDLIYQKINFTISLLDTYNLIKQVDPGSPQIQQEAFLEMWEGYFDLYKSEKDGPRVIAASRLFLTALKDKLAFSVSPLRDLLGDFPVFWKAYVNASKRARDRFFEKKAEKHTREIMASLGKEEMLRREHELMVYARELAKQNTLNFERLQNACPARNNQGSFRSASYNERMEIVEKFYKQTEARKIATARAVIASAVAGGFMLKNETTSFPVPGAGVIHPEAVMRAAGEGFAGFAKMNIFMDKDISRLSFLSLKTRRMSEKIIKSVGVAGISKIPYFSTLLFAYDIPTVSKKLGVELSSDLVKEYFNNYFVNPYFYSLLCLNSKNKQLGYALAFVFYIGMRSFYEALLYHPWKQFWIKEQY